MSATQTCSGPVGTICPGPPSTDWDGGRSGDGYRWSCDTPAWGATSRRARRRTSNKPSRPILIPAALSGQANRWCSLRVPIRAGVSGRRARDAESGRRVRRCAAAPQPLVVRLTADADVTAGLAHAQSQDERLCEDPPKLFSGSTPVFFFTCSMMASNSCAVLGCLPQAGASSALMRCSGVWGLLVLSGMVAASPAREAGTSQSCKPCLRTIPAPSGAFPESP